MQLGIGSQRVRSHRGALSLTRRVHWHGLFLFGLSLLVVALDQYTKWLVRKHLPLNRSWNPITWLSSIVTLTRTQNTGAAFGLFPQMGLFLVIVPLAVVVAIIIYYRQLAAGSWMLRVALGLQLGGAVGNLVDRVCLGYVTDFLDFRVWPVFNLADSAIVVGTTLLAIYALFLDPARKGDLEAEDEPQRGADGEG